MREKKEIGEFIKEDLLYDFYGELLSPKQKKIYEEVMFCDCSISEVARNENVSRQNISDIIKRSNKILLSYENKLSLLERFIKTKNLVNEIKLLAREFLETKDISKIEEIDRISDSILDKI